MLTPFALESLQAIDHHWHKPMFVTVGDTATWWQGAVGALILQLQWHRWMFGTTTDQHL